MNGRTIRITERCEFGEPGDLLSPEPWDIAAVLVETRGVAVYVENATLPQAQSTERQTKRRRPGTPITSDK